MLNPIKKGFKVITFPAEWKKRVEGNSSITIESYFSYLKVLLRNMIYIATTTINKPTKALKLFAKNKNCKLVVALDKKSKKFKLNNTITLSTNYQEKKWPKLSKLVGWNCIQRRNFAILEAFERGAEIVALIDDDNIPYNNWFKNIYINKKIKCKEIKTNKIIFDPVGYTNHNNLWHRGCHLNL